MAKDPPPLFCWVKGLEEPKIATLRKLILHVHGDGGAIDFELKGVQVVKDQTQRHIVYLLGQLQWKIINEKHYQQNGQVRIILARDGSKTISAFSEEHEIFGVVPIDPNTQKPNLPTFIQRLLA
mgnify:CR=1 FL=1